MDVMTLKWSNIDFINSMITLISQKTGRVISLPLSSYLITELKKYKASVGNEKECLFHDLGKEIIKQRLDLAIIL